MSYILWTLCVLPYTLATCTCELLVIVCWQFLGLFKSALRQKSLEESPVLPAHGGSSPDVTSLSSEEAVGYVQVLEGMKGGGRIWKWK